jgi:integrase
VGARDRDGSAIRRSVTSCDQCLAWGLTYAQGVCLACYNFAAARFGHHVGDCGGCGLARRLKKGFCRLCWCQARLDRLASAGNARDAVVLGPYLPQVRHHQLFLVGFDRRYALPRTMPRRYGAKGRPFKAPPPVAGAPVIGWVQPALFDAGPRAYRYSSIDLRTQPPPDNPWLAWGLHLAHTIAEARGWPGTVRRAMQRVLVMLLAEHHSGERIRVSDFQRITTRHGTDVDCVVEILTLMDVVDDDRPAAMDGWLTARLGRLPRALRDDLHAWAVALRDGTPRTRARSLGTVRTYVSAALPAVTAWSSRYTHLREVVREDVVAHLDTLQGEARRTALCALRSLFGWAKRTGTIFRNPTVQIRGPRREHAIWQPLTGVEIDAAITAADTVQARVFVALSAVHAARPGQIRAMQLVDVDLARRCLTIGGNTRPLDDLTYRVLLEWLEHRRRAWPRTANPHLLINKITALRLGPVGHTWILNLRRLPATLERLRIDRQLEESLATGGDPLQLVKVFAISERAAVRYADNARALLQPEPEHGRHRTPPADRPPRE